jgi:hypothetical protein
VTKLAPPVQWRLSRETRLESGKRHIDGVDIEGIPIRLCTIAHPLTADGANAEPAKEGNDR